MSKFSLDNQLCFEVYRAASQFTRLYTKVLQRFDLTYPQYLVLLCLWEENRQTTSQIGEKLELGIGTLNPVVNKLCDKEWITKSPSPIDGRASILCVTTKATTQQPLIEQAIEETMRSNNYLLHAGFELKKQLSDLNSSLRLMIEEE